jgi:murein DD-endopeptidase MepM/ murein hydrolase activator NlpD
MLRALAILVVVVLLVFAGAYVVAGRGAPPQLTVSQPGRFVGQTGSVEVAAAAPNAKFTALSIALEQNGKTIPLYSLDRPQNATVTQTDRNRVDISRPIGKQAIPELVSGPARIVVTATRPSFLNLRQLSSSATKEFQVRLERPRISVVSTHHYVNHGGAEMVVYRATPADVMSGVRVGTVEYPGFALKDDLRAAYFALLWNQDLNTAIKAFARDEAGNESTATFVDNVFEKPQKKSTIQLDDKFLNRVVPDIAEHAPELKLAPPPEGSDMLPGFLKENGELRKLNADFIASLAKKTAATRLWDGPFVQMGNSKVEASFADHRTYFYKGKEVDQQVHLGFDLAVTEHIPVLAAGTGTVVNADWLGIYGNCVVIDHGQGVQSLYAHLMSFDVRVGDNVTRGQQIGRSDSTGLAGGDHLHFTMLVGGQMVNPVEWWDPHWIADRVDRKLREAGVQ